MDTPKRLMFIRYINARCEIMYFNSYNQAIRYIWDNYDHPYKKFFSKTFARKTRAKIKVAVENKKSYLGGQWVKFNPSIMIKE